MARVLRSDPSSRVDLPITPMLDMTFQLLAFFVLTFHADTALEGRMEFSLPNSGQGRADEPLPLAQFSDRQLEEATQLTVHVRTIRDGVSDGNISALILQTSEGEMLIRDVSSLRQNLAARRPENGQAEIRIVADARLKYACVVDVMDACLQSGYRNVGFSTPPDLGVQ